MYRLAPPNPKLYKLYLSSNPEKKFDVYVENTTTGRIKKVSFGASSYEDYTIHKDKDRRKLYRNRHKGDKINNHLFAGFWSWHVLWGRSSSLESAMKYTINNLGNLSVVY